MYIALWIVQLVQLCIEFMVNVQYAQYVKYAECEE